VVIISCETSIKLINFVADGFASLPQFQVNLMNSDLPPELIISGIY